MILKLCELYFVNFVIDSMLKIKYESKMQNKDLDKYLWTTLTQQHFTRTWNYPGLSMGVVLLIFLVFLDLFIALLVLVLCLVPNVALSLDFYCDCTFITVININFTLSQTLLVRYICWWTISPWGYHPPSIQCRSTDIVYYIYLLLLQLLYKVIIDKTKVLFPRVWVTLADLPLLFRSFGFIVPKTLNYLDFQLGWWRLFQ